MTCASNLMQVAEAEFANGMLTAEGSVANVLGDPRIALTWSANELCAFDDGLLAGEVGTTGNCITPMRIAPGDQIRIDFGAFGLIEAAFS